MKFLGVNIGKLINISCKITGKGGTSLPGKIALKYDSKLIEKLIGPIKNNKVIITGTNGKTTTSGLIASILTTAGKSVVHNKEGANMKTGIATALIKSSNFLGNLQKDATVFEVDEANMPIVIEDVKPNIVVITNFFRDQLDRYGELDTTVEKVKKALLNLPQDSIVLLNADEPFTASIGDEIKSKVFYYGIEDNIEGINSSSFEQKYCPICAHKYEYKKIYYGQLGDYYCPNCGKKRPNPNFKATNIFLNEDGINFNLYYKDKIFTVKSRLIGLYNVYNLLAAISAGILLNIDFSTILKAIESYWPIEGRLQKTKIKSKRTIINLIKNPIGFESTLNMLSQFNKPLNLLISINDNYADGRDVSWLWDVNLESFLSKTKVNYIVTSGLRAEDMAVRLKYAGFDIKKIKIINSIEKALDTIADLTEEELIAVLPNYTSLYDVSKYLKLQEAKK
ncbi:UDP-N-acetylmuramyl tripeptide synthase [Thermoanaerobacter thermohydrosulfuricus]|uniref:Lipid II isoglutaminyl synthase (glutamine-hydrolyzing) subunit MurT n=2 Tax=Thermoanaerobacter thermohydrosulfuricus TaxID=1516 RepID=M8CZB9_THETY|nr:MULTISPECIES: Mur ligase family protein [Thermoanaerobacter]EMT39653.1 UDP-N-acetylmuramyl tripeptide synthase [Thermoanaerobacter thermohydrosulfuricus WC1]SDF44577.1 UDP-N-acetylmuramyl tripeptide synthase [Thermoanaerobacter thermohydrosulfuricus]HHY80117.1 Mur ligase family protein [Thermoanaerobacter sp.]